MRALISLSDKTGIESLAAVLVKAGWQLISTGGTASLLRERGLEVSEISDVTGFPECMGGRLKTLHPKVHGGILARLPEDEAAMRQQDIAPIALVIVNFYPFNEAVADSSSTDRDCIGQIDIGGPAMVRAAAKNHERVTVAVNPERYPELAEIYAAGAEPGPELRRRLAAEAFSMVADYDSAIAGFLGGTGRAAAGEDGGFADRLQPRFYLESVLAYGENPHQRGALYRSGDGPGPGASRQLSGLPLSYNNWLDFDAAWDCVRSLPPRSAVVVKHGIPCGAAVGPSAAAALKRALECDAQSAYGGIVAVNCELDGDAARICRQHFIEGLAAPEISDEAEAELADKPRPRLLCIDDGGAGQGLDIRTISGGLLVQDADPGGPPVDASLSVSRQKPTENQLRDLEFAWQLVRFFRSNAIVIARDQQLLGAGSGQTSRVFAVEIALLKAKQCGHAVAGAALASDAFFPFRDGVDLAAAAGVTAIIHPGGSKRDPEVEAAAAEHDLALLATGRRCFRH